MAVALLPGQRWRQRKPTYGASVNFAHSTTRGLIGRWLFNDNGASMLRDLCVGRNALLQGSAAWNGRSRFGAGSIFGGGSASYITLSGNSPLNGLSAFTAMGWIQGASTNSHSFFSLWDGTANQILIRQSGGGGPWGFFTFTTGQVGGTITGMPTVGEWQHCAFVYTGATMLVYLNGIQDATTFAQSGALQANTTNPLRITGDETTRSSERNLHGYIDNVSLYNRALTEGEVRHHYLEPFCDIAVQRNRFYSFSTGSTPFSADLSAPSFAFSPQAITRLNAYQASLSAPSFVMAPQTLTRFNAYQAALSAPQFPFSPQALTVFGADVVSMSAPSFAFSPQTMEQVSGFQASLSAPSFTFSPQSLTRFNAYKASLDAPLFKFTPNSIDYTAEGAEEPQAGGRRGMISVLNNMGLRK